MDNLTLAIEILTRCETEKKRLEEYEKEYAVVEKAGGRVHMEKVERSIQQIQSHTEKDTDQQRHKICTEVTCRIIYQMIGGKVNE